jgi:peroxiredoxin
LRLRKGEPARDFQVTDISGKRISLKDYSGRKLMLSFYRYAACLLCNLRVYKLIQHYPSLHKKGLEMVAFYQSPKKSVLRYLEKLDAPFPIVGDPKREVYALYRVESSLKGYLKGLTRVSEIREARRLGFTVGRAEGDKNLIPADFLIGPDLRIEEAYYGEDIGDHMPIEAIERFLNHDRA